MQSSFQLSVEKKILVHLSGYSKYSDAWEAPYQISQEGIAERFGLLLNNVSRAMNSLKDDGLVHEKLKHVKSMKRRRKTYFLTDKGLDVVKNTKDAIHEERITYLDVESKAKTESVIDLMEYLNKKLKIAHDVLHVIRFSQVSDPFDSKGFKRYLERSKRESEYVAYVEKAPIVPEFVGRANELQSVQGILDDEDTRILVIQGIAGIGKTSVGVKILEEYKTKRYTFWHKIRDFDSIKSVTREISEFLGMIGKKRLGSYIKSSKPLELGVLSDLFESEFKGETALLIFDDFQNASAEVVKLFSMFADIATRMPTLTIVILTRQAVNFYEVSDAAISRIVKELTLEGLDPSSTRIFLRPMGLSKGEVDAIYELTKGSPLFLELILKMGVEEGTSSLRKFVEDSIYNKLTEQEREVLSFMTVYRHPVALELLLIGNIKYDHISNLAKNSIVVEYPGDYFEVHDVIKERIYGLLNQEQRTEFHNKVAKIYLKTFESSSLEDDESTLYMYEVIYQFQQAGAWTEAFSASRRFVPELLARGVREVKELLERFDLKEIPKDQLADFHILKGDAYTLNENWDDALENYQKALKLKEKGARKEDLAHLHSSIAEAQMHIKRWSDMIKSHQSALKLFEESENEKGIARELIALGTGYRTMKRYDESLESYNKCLKLLEKLDDKLGTAVALNNMALVYDSMGAWRKAKDTIEKSLGYLDGKENEVEKARVLYNLGGLLFNRSQHENAIEVYTKSLELFNKHKHDGSVKSAIRIGDIYFANNNFERALRYYQNAKSMHSSRSKGRKSMLGRKEPQKDTRIEQINEKLINVLRELGNWEGLVKILREDANRLEGMKDDSGLAVRYLELGLALENLELFETAYKSLLKARNILDSKKDVNGLVAVDLNLGRTYKKAGDKERSVQAYKRALANAKKSSNKSAIGIASTELGNA